MLYLDHGIIFVADLAAAAAEYQRLGFLLTPRGGHPSLGTANHTIMLDQNYLELLAVVTRGAGNERWAAILDRGEGLGGVALGTKDARATREALRSRGVAASDVVDFERPVGLGFRQGAARFSVAHLPSEASPAIAAFFCQHHTPELVWRPEFQQHPNTAFAVAGLTIVDRDPERRSAAYQRLLGGAAIHSHPGGLELDLRGTRVLLVTPRYAEARLGQRLALPEDGTRPLGVTLAVHSLATARQVLAANAVPFGPFGKGSILVVPPATRGVYLEFLAA